jgi:hypothetical protein
MRILQAIATGIIVSALALAPVLGSSRQADMQITAASREQLIESLIRVVNESYVFPDMAKRVDAAVRKQQRRGVYDGISSAQQLAEVLTYELQATTARDLQP